MTAFEAAHLQRHTFHGNWNYTCAMRRSVVSPAQRGEMGGRSLGPMANPEPKGKGDHSMPGNWRSCPGVRGDAPGDPRDMVKAGLPEA